MDKTISVRFPKEDLNEIEIISKEEKRKKSEVLREIMYKGIMVKKLEIALKKFQDNEATISKAAEIAGISLTKFMDILYKRGINFHYTLEDFKEDTKDL